jgi:hypothetical protein
MKHFFVILFFALCATASAQTIKTLGYNTTNGQVVYTNTNALTFSNAVAFGDFGIQPNSGGLYWTTNLVFEVETATFYSAINFSSNAVASSVRTNLGLTWTGLTNTNAATFQSALFSATNAAPTNTNAPTPDAWVDIQVGTNTYKLPLWQ